MASISSEIMEMDENEEEPPIGDGNTGSQFRELVILAENRDPYVTRATFEIVELHSGASTDSNDISDSEIASPAGNSTQETVSASLNSEAENTSTSNSPKKRKFEELTAEEDESQSCPICLDNWTTSGDHRLCCLKCGHLFGYKCIIRWLNTEVRKSCPTCKKKVHLNDIRYIYARKIIAMDTTELTIANQKLQGALEEKNKTQIELSKAICRTHSLTQEVDDYKKKLNAMMHSRRTETAVKVPASQSSRHVVSLYKEKTIELGKNTGCRVFDCKTTLDTIAVTIKSSFHLYSGFGIKRISIANYKSTAFIPLHSQIIRDIKFHERQPWLLTCSVDKKAKILDMNTNTTTITLENESPLWSCCWGVDNDHTMYLGQQQGSAMKFDLRQPSEPVCTMSVPGDLSPVVSVQAIKSSSQLPFGGIISCKLNSIWAFETIAGDEPPRYLLPLEGPFTSMTYQKDCDHLLLSSRPNSRCAYSRHFLCGLYKQEDGLKCNVVHTFRGGNTQKMLSRPCLISSKNNYAAAYVEDQRCVALWNINTGDKVSSIPAHETVLDLNSVKTSNADFLLSLTESKLEFFKFARHYND